MKKRLFSAIVLFAINVTIVFLAILSIFLIGNNSPFIAVRWVFAIVFLFFLPGNILTEILFLGHRDGKFGAIERFSMSLGLSFITISLTLSLLNFFWEISLFSLLTSVSIIVFSASTVALYLKLSRSHPRHIRSTPTAANPKTIASSKNVSMQTIRENALFFSFLCGVFVMLFSFVISPLFLIPQTSYVWAFAMNNNILDLLLLLFGALASIGILKTKQRGKRLLCYVLVAVSIAVAIKARILPALVSLGVGGDIGIDNWDSIGHMNSVIQSGHYSATEPYFLVYQNGEFLQPPNVLAPGYFCLMAAVSMMTGISPLNIPKTLFLVGALQPLLLYVVVKRKTGDDAKAIFSAFLIAGGSLLSDHIRYSSGSTSPVEAFSLTLILIGVYFLTFKQTRTIRALELFLILSLLSTHFVTAFLYFFILLVYLGPKILSLNDFKGLFQGIKQKNLSVIVTVTLFALLTTVFVFWLPVMAHPHSHLGIHYVERSTFFSYVRPEAHVERESLYTVITQHFFMNLKEEGLYIFLILYGSYWAIRKRERFFSSWIFALAFLGVFMHFANPNVSPLSYASPFIAFLNQAACAAGGVAIIDDFFHKPLPNVRKLTDVLRKVDIGKLFMSISILFVVLYLAFIPVFVRIQSPDEIYVRGSPEIFGYAKTTPKEVRYLMEVYLEAVSWSLENFPENAILVVNISRPVIADPFISHPVNLFRHMGVTMLVGTNLTLSDYGVIVSSFQDVYALKAREFVFNDDPTRTIIQYSYRNADVIILKLLKIVEG